MSLTRVSVPQTARKGEIVEVKALIRHPMETGFRRGSRGEVIERDIITRFECHFEDELVFEADFFPAVAANPFLSFFMTAEKTGTLSFRWTDQTGTIWADQTQLTVS